MAEPIKFYTDEHVARSVAVGLRRRGVDVLTVPEAAMRGASDIDHLGFATHHPSVSSAQSVAFLSLPTATLATLPAVGR